MKTFVFSLSRLRGGMRSGQLNLVLVAVHGMIYTPATTCTPYCHVPRALMLNVLWEQGAHEIRREVARVEAST